MTATAPTTLMKNIGYGAGYQYAHDFKDAKSDMECLPQEIIGTKLYEPGKNVAEQKYAEVLKMLWKDKYGYGY